MKGKLFRLFAALLVAALSVSNPAAAATYNIVIDGKSASHPVEIVFDESDIAPGYSNTYHVGIENRLPSGALVKLSSTVEDVAQGSPLLDEVTFSFVYNSQILTAGKHLTAGLTDQELVCVAPNSVDSLDLKLDFDRDAENNLQATSFKLLFNFVVTDQGCNSSGANGGPKWPLLPNTGQKTVLPPTYESSTVFYSSIGLIAVSLFFTLLFGFLVLVRRRKDDGKEQPKPVYTPKRKGGLEIGHGKKH
jgi:hypothetical protein